jgi:hypothetical protein
MDESLLEYKRFIDRLVGRVLSVEGRRIRSGVWHPEPPPDQHKYNELLRSLSADQRELVAQLVDGARSGGMHDVLVQLTDGDYRLSRKGVELAQEPFGTEVYFDFVARSAGDAWPDER